jgi:hyperosmotically inducible protein
MKALNTYSILAVLVLGGCSTSPKPVSEVRITNTDVEHAVKARLAAEPLLANLSIGVSADVDKNQITLTGTVPTEPMRMQVVNIARAARPGVSVVDKIDVKPAEVSRADYTEEMAREARRKAESVGDKVGSSADDAWIHAKIFAKLAADSQTPARKINIDVVNHSVTLRGTVETVTARHEAERVARDTDGVRHVTNLIKVQGRAHS